MSKVLIFSDLQLLSENVKMQYRLGILDQIIQIANKQKVQEVLCVGDFFDRRYIPVNLHHEVVKRLVMFGGKWVFVAGNHDLYGGVVSALDPYRISDRVEVYTEPVATKKWVYLPYTKDLKLLKSILAAAKKSGVKLVAGHIPLSWQERDSFGLGERDFSGFDMCFFGHYHVPEQKKNLFILGSPYVVSFDDARGETDDRYVYIFNEQTKKITPIVLDYKRYVTVTDPKLLTDFEKYVYRLEIPESALENLKVDKSVQLKIIPSEKLDVSRIDKDRVLDDEYILKEYLKSKDVKPSSRDGKRLLSLGKALIKQGTEQ